MVIDRSKMRKNIGERVEESSKKTSGPRSYQPYIMEDKLPIPFFKKIPEGVLVFDIIPFTVSENFLVNPATQRPEYVEDQWYYFLDLYIHKGVGPNNHDVVCPKMHLGKPCPICEIVESLKSTMEYGDPRWESEVKPLLAKRRGVYQIWIHDKSKEEENKGVQVLEISWHMLEKFLIAISKDPESGETIPFAYPGVEGRRISFTRKGTGSTNTSYFGHTFSIRKQDIPDEILEQACQINDYITIMNAAEIQKLLDADEEGDEDSKDASQDDEEQREERKPKANSLGRRPRREIKEEPEDQKEPDEKPLSRREARLKREAEEKAKNKDEDNLCPLGHEYGVDTDDHADCDNCPEKVYNACLAVKDNA